MDSIRKGAKTVIKEITAYQCDKCGKAYMLKESAEKCCAPRHCEGCGIEIPKKHYYTVCDSCLAKHEAEKIIVMTVDEYWEKYPDLPVWFSETSLVFEKDYDDDFFRDIFDNDYDVAYGVTPIAIQLNEEHAISSLEENAGVIDQRLFPPEAYDEYAEFVQRWNEKYATIVYSRNEYLHVVPDKEATNNVKRSLL
jgi:hypothetical protein